MEYLDVLRDIRCDLQELYTKLKETGTFDEAKNRFNMVEYHMLKAIGDLGVIIDDLSD